jgi:S-adenosylmethionine:tRNA ribosyltransferase-isomerase
LDDRSASRLMHLERASGVVAHRQFRDCLKVLEAGDLLVLNDTRVTARRLHGRRPTGGAVEALVLRREGDSHVALARPAKRLRPGTRTEFSDGLGGTVIESLGEGLLRLAFDRPDEADSALRTSGEVPLPPYVHERLDDPERYQTVYAATPGSAAAPTAGLHFTPEVLEALKGKGVRTATVTLDVGLDTFRPVATETTDEHQMHGERCQVSEETAEAVSKCQGRIVAVGTTSVRTLESLATGPRQVRAGETVTRIFITPQTPVRVADGLFTNFHMPRTTMLFMVAAFCGREALMAAYAEAVRERYRFLSFGDSMLIL